MKFILLLTSMSMLSVPAMARHAIVVCNTDRDGWTYEFDGEANRITTLVVRRISVTAEGLWHVKEYSFDTSRKDQFDYDGRTLEIFPEPQNFPEGIRLVNTECFA